LRYHVTIGSDPYTVDVEELANGSLDVRLDGRPIDVDVAPAGRQLSVRVGGQMIDLTTDGRLPEMGVVARGHRSRVHVESERTRSAARGARAKATGGGTVVKSPMPGRVVKVLVARGELVQTGQGLMVLEAMKMENEVRARAAGTVAQVHVTEGATVEANATLVTLV
jgi:glutaconyl-CoA/methylmalonyl-CoA decarboxylase subunit gamma